MMIKKMASRCLSTGLLLVTFLIAARCAKAQPIFDALDQHRFSVFHDLLNSSSSSIEDVDTAHGLTRLSHACDKGDIEAAKYLVKAGFSVNPKHPRGGRLPLCRACFSHSITLVKWLLSKGALVNPTSPDGGTPLMAAAQDHDPRIAEILLKAGADPTARDGRGMTPLHFAATTGASGAALLLLKHGALVDALDKELETPLMTCCHAFGDSATASVLLDHGASTTLRTRDHQCPIHLAAMTNGYQSPRVSSLLHCLLLHGADVDAEDQTGTTALMVVVSTGATDTVNLNAIDILASFGARIGKKNDKGFSPLLWAAMYGNFAATEKLLQLGADPNTTDDHGSTVASYARQFKHDKVFYLLKAHGATE